MVTGSLTSQWEIPLTRPTPAECSSCTEEHDEDLMDDQEYESEQPPRQPYTAPAIVEHADFETLALACGTQPGTPACYTGGGYEQS